MEDNNNSAVESQQANGAHGVIYKITCLVSGKIYVGRTQQKLSKRIYKHKYEAKRGRPGVDAAIAKYGWENFTVEVIETCPIDQLNDREIFWIRELDSKAPNGYNLTDGGEGCTGYKHTAESCAKISANHHDVSGEKNPNYGKKTPPEVCAKISANHADVKGEKNPNYGKPLSKEQRAAISVRMSGENNPFFGKHRSPETCTKISASLKATLAKKKLERGGEK